MKLFGYELTGFAKAAVIMAAVFLLAIGLCSVSGTIEARHGWSILGQRGIPDTALGNFVAILDWVGAGAMVVSLLCLGLVLVGWPLSVVYRKLMGTHQDHVQSLFNKTLRKGEDD